MIAEERWRNQNAQIAEHQLEVRIMHYYRVINMLVRLTALKLQHGVIWQIYIKDSDALI